MLPSPPSAKFGKRTTAAEVASALGERAKGKTFMITGGNSGIGKETARVLAKAGGSVIICCRDVSKGEEAKAEILRETSPAGKLSVLELDLGSLRSIRTCTEAFLRSRQPLHVLINNAGVMACPFGRTQDGFELQFGTNHLGHFYLTQLLLPILKLSGSQEEPARVVCVSSAANVVLAPAEGIDFEAINAYRQSSYSAERYNPWSSYGVSKLSNLVFSVEMQRRMAREEECHVGFVALHPGVITSTQLYRHGDGSFQNFRALLASAGLGRLLGLLEFFDRKSIPEGAATTVLCALGPQVKFGSYYSDCELCEDTHRLAFDVDLGQKLFRVSEEMTACSGADEAAGISGVVDDAPLL